MKLQNIPILVAVLLWSLSVPVLAHGGRSGGGHSGGARIGVGGGFRGVAGPRGFVVASPRGFVAGRNFGHHGGRFDHRGHFNRQGGFNNVVVYGGYGGYPYYPYGYPTYPNNTTYQYPQSYYYSNPAPVAAYNPAPVNVTGDVVSNVQRVLKAQRFYYGPIDGISGPATRAAIRAYDAAAGLPVTGMIDSSLLASLRLL